jgi:hypothetical protein
LVVADDRDSLSAKPEFTPAIQTHDQESGNANSVTSAVLDSSEMKTEVGSQRGPVRAAVRARKRQSRVNPRRGRGIRHRRLRAGIRCQSVDCHPTIARLAHFCGQSDHVNAFFKQLKK